ncbi:hypothetical protein HDV05_002904, partial [Chytridiales sp. JEL 0842]
MNKRIRQPLVSDEFTLHQALHPKPLEAINPFDDILYAQCVSRFPERFNFDWMVGLFKSWTEQTEMSTIEL